jgi:uncharacterized protein (DUF1800 family)
MGMPAIRGFKMLPTQQSFERKALNRVTFGARDLDEKYAQTIGWPAWVNEQLAAPPGDDPDLAAFIATQTMHIEYAAAPDTSNGTWPAVKEERPLVSLTFTTSDLWSLYAGNGTAVSGSEIFRIRQELAAATWIRNTHAKFQLREFMTDFWHNHFNVGKASHETGTIELPIYDRDVIRPNVFGNFRDLLHATATSTSMMIYLDNWLSRATTPNENYSREVLELHTLGADVYLGIINPDPPSVQAGPYKVTAGFTDADVTQASRALSGWTVANGQYVRAGKVLPMTGEFAYDPAMHNTSAGTFMGVDLTKITGDMAQGYRVLDIAAYHPATARFVCGKLCTRIFGEGYPQSAFTRAYNAWMNNQDMPNQIAEVLRAILIGGPEVGTLPSTKLRRPYEHLIAMFRASDMVVSAGTTMTSAFDAVSDFLFAWTPPNGRPDTNTYWLTTGALLAVWNNAMTWGSNTAVKTTLTVQTPDSVNNNVSTIVEYWVNRMVGYSLSATAMSALTNDATTAGIPSLIRARTPNPTTIENAYRRLVGLIAQAPEFMYR